MKTYKIKAYYKWNGRIAYLHPVFFSYHVGLQMKDDQFGSIFCRRIDEFNYPFTSRVQLVFIKAAYYLKMRVWWYAWIWFPNQYKKHFWRTFNINQEPKSSKNWLPF